jgi:CheY-like chemotaxis protein
LEVCRQLVQTEPRLRIILLTADTSAIVREQALSRGAFAVIAKHQVPDLLLPGIEDALRDLTRTERR